MTAAMVADEEALRALFKKAETERAFWKEHYAELLEKYPDQFVAVRDGKVIAHSPRLLKIVALLKRQGLKPTDVWTEFIRSNSRPLIL